MKAAYVFALSIGGVSCFPKLAPIIQTHVERRFFDSHLQLRDDGDEATTSTDATTDETLDSSGKESATATTSTTSASDASATDSATTDTSINVTIMDTTGTLQLNPGVDGNLFISLPEDAASITNLVPGNSEFVAYTDSLTVMGDNSETSRLLYYYPDEMSKLSVSRFRLGAWGSIPKGAQLASFVPFNDGNGNEVLVALDTSGNYFWPIVCALDGQLNKVFIAQDPEEGPEILMTNGDLRYILTGGDVTDCGPLALTASGLSGSYS
ncbi:hypothetical protein PFICI_01620 [Pestalotiopsis fici W106-1]|uniref:Uncharacterized protein n=1 Tax=Pestalotiopsis fici (strain W106-1 / CGMCC3.15140) TaxID=1229662 RepID=W3XQK1_PESFW|nr:uncharacterized protein PFICI_01620 [Pestalotiopsis fici W106-1]ETS87792.1 hypothetical protein PFICI_01620 [Pestalotiopsis fici W106-1]